MQELIAKVATYVEEYMTNFDSSHDFSHIKRVVGLAHRIHSQMATPISKTENHPPSLDLYIITLSALLHDIGDRKYIQEGQDAETMVRDVLLNLGASHDLAEKVQTICLGISYSSEVKDPTYVMNLIQRYPELACVQDADRIDAIGAVGVGRAFTYGAAKVGRNMGETIELFDVKLFKLESLMKTAPGKELARERTRRLREFYQWWDDEMGIGEVASVVLQEQIEETVER